MGSTIIRKYKNGFWQKTYVLWIIKRNSLDERLQSNSEIVQIKETFAANDSCTQVF